MSIFNRSALIGGSAPAGGYVVDRSVRLRSSATASLSRTFAAGNRQKWTWSGWVKRGALGADQTIFSCYYASNDNETFHLSFFNDNTLRAGLYTQYAMITNQVFRDPSAWYHIVFAFDSTQATPSNRWKLYVNGAQVTSLGLATYPGLNDVWAINAAQIHYHGYLNVFGWYLDGYLTEVNFIDSQALTPSSFGETNADTGVWQPKEYTGTYGTTGFYLNFSNPSAATAAALGADYSGNGNNWTPSNISVTAGVTYDSMIDTPTPVADERGNFAVLNPLAANVAGTVRDGNLTLYQGSPSHSYALSSITLDIPVYAEMLANTTYSDAALGLGIQKASTAVGGTQDIQFYSNVSSQLYLSGALQWYSTLFVTNDIIQIAFDPATGKVWLGRNNTWYNSSGGTTGDPSTGANPTATLTTGIPYVIVVNAYQHVAYMNFGQRPFSYTPPTGFKALQTGNLPEPTIVDGGEYFNTVLYTGNAGSQSITGVGFQPDFVWGKLRNTSSYHRLHDAVRGADNTLATNVTDAEVSGNGLVSFDADGFTMDSGTNINQVYPYVAWNWKAGGTAVSNTDGSITSTVSAGVTQGFSVVTYTGTGANATVGHGLGVAPKMVIVKARSGASAQHWRVNHASLNTAGGAFLTLSTTAAVATDSTIFNSTAPTSSVFSVGTSNSANGSGYTYVAYCFAEVPGFSKFGSYTGNGSTDGPFQYLGFAPAFIMLKRTDSTGNWSMYDRARSPKNADTKVLYPNLSNAEDASTDHFDWLSNGFKMKSTNQNTSGGTFIYMAFAESPFKNSLAR